MWDFDLMKLRASKEGKYISLKHVFSFKAIDTIIKTLYKFMRTTSYNRIIN